MLNITATVDDPFVILVTSLLGSSPGNAAFDSSTDHTFRIASATGGVTGFDASLFSLSLTNFSNPLNGGTFALQNSGNDINLVFTANAEPEPPGPSPFIPEPSTFALAALGLLALGIRRTRR